MFLAAPGSDLDRHSRCVQRVEIDVPVAEVAIDELARLNTLVSRIGGHIAGGATS
jgi:hypothetical protein